MAPKRTVKKEPTPPAVAGVKREADDEAGAAAGGATAVTGGTGKVRKTAKTKAGGSASASTTRPGAGSGSASGSGSGGAGATARAPPGIEFKAARSLLAAAVVRRGCAAALGDIHALAGETGLTPKQIQNQLSPGRHNLRRALEDAARGV